MIYGLIALSVAAIAFFTLRPDASADSLEIYGKPTNGNFVVSVNATGELKAKKSIKIQGPQGMRSAGIYNTTIKDLIPEGTVVKKGDYVASLDKTELATKITSVQTDIEKELTKLEQIKIDTAIQMKGVRDDIANQLFAMAQEELEIERNKYEPQMVIDQSELKLKNSIRSLDQLRAKTDLMVIQSDAKVREIQANLKQLDGNLNQLTEVAASFRISAPEDGMLIYERSWNGKKGPGSQISAWDPTVAELPDLTKMTSVAYINEIDISKIRKGQKVKVKVDAFPEKDFDGQIITVANIGQELRGQEAKVFEIVIAIEQIDDILRPAMTTTNNIMIYEYEDVVSLPLEAFYSDSIDYAFVKTSSGIVRQQIVSGAANENDIIVIEGIAPEDKVLLTAPEDAEAVPYRYLESVAIASGKSKLEDWKKQKSIYDNANEEKVKGEEDINRNDENSGGAVMFF